MFMIDRTYSPNNHCFGPASIVFEQKFMVDFIMFHRLDSAQPLRNSVTSWDGCSKHRKASGIISFQQLDFPNQQKLPIKIGHLGVFQAVGCIHIYGILAISAV